MEEHHADCDEHATEVSATPAKKPFVSRFSVGQQLLAVWLIGVILGFSLGKFSDTITISRKGATANTTDGMAMLETIAPVKGVTLPVTWGSLGKQLVAAGVIDQKKFEELYAQRGGMDEEAKRLLYGADNGQLTITPANSGLILNLLWGLGLGNKNEILETGMMMDNQFGGADKFASTGGWSLGSGNVMNHYSRHAFMSLTPAQQELVARVAKNVYRPCCGNPTHFPDCNHGMAMLGLLELMASQGADEAALYRAALATNAYWFPDQYATIGKYLATKGSSLTKTSPQELVGQTYVSAQGYQQIQSIIEPVQNGGGSGCGA